MPRARRAPRALGRPWGSSARLWDGSRGGSASHPSASFNAAAAASRPPARPTLARPRVEHPSAAEHRCAQDAEQGPRLARVRARRHARAPGRRDGRAGGTARRSVQRRPRPISTGTGRGSDARPASAHHTFASHSYLLDSVGLLGPRSRHLDGVGQARIVVGPQMVEYAQDTAGSLKDVKREFVPPVSQTRTGKGKAKSRMASHNAQDEKALVKFRAFMAQCDRHLNFIRIHRTKRKQEE